jgi:shikimate dehydrogenase
MRARSGSDVGMSAPKAFVIGWPIAHSRSPLIHGFWLKTHGLAGSYDKIAVPPDDLHGFLRTLAANGFVGGNVTIPHKETVAALCERLTPSAERLGAVNTVWFEDSTLWGDSTDGLGFLGALDQDVDGWDDRKHSALIIGAGGAARAIVDAVQTRGFDRVIVANRTVERATGLAERLGCQAVGLDAVQALLPSIDLLVNTTAAGMAGQGDLDLDLDALPDHAIVDDIVYVPTETALLRRAKMRGLRTVGGLGMLLHQAVPGFERWFGIRPRVTAELRTLIEADIAGTRG